MTIEILKHGKKPGPCPECGSLDTRILSDRFECGKCLCQWRDMDSAEAARMTGGRSELLTYLRNRRKR